MAITQSASPGDDDIAAILRDTRTIAVVGLSADPRRASNDVFAFLLARGYDCVGVNPGLAGKRIHGAPVFASLAEVDRPVDMVDIFRAVEAIGGIVDAALALDPRPKVVWMQLGLVEEAAAARARAAGLHVVMNRCPKIEIARLGA
jgi:predicted CoA-binding protein